MFSSQRQNSVQYMLVLNKYAECSKMGEAATVLRFSQELGLKVPVTRVSDFVLLVIPVDLI